MGEFLKSVFGLEGKHVLITGASSGIGEHFAWTCTKAGAESVTLAARRIDRLETLAKEISRQYPKTKVIAIALDIGKDLSHFKQVLNDAESKLHGITYDVLVNNAGVGPDGYVLSVTEASFNETMNINLRGAFFLSQECANRWVNRGFGKSFVEGKNHGMSIINISSIYGQRVGLNNSHYAISKAALIQATKAMAIEVLQHGIRVNCICPGYYRSEMTSDFYDSEKGKKYLKTKIPSKRLGLLPELDGALLLLASNASSNMTGSVITVDGGHVTSAL